MALTALEQVTDTVSLDAQVAAKADAKAVAAGSAASADAQRLAVDALACQLEAERLQTVTATGRSIGAAQAAQALLQKAKEESAAALVSATNPGEGGVASLRQFDGEDVENKTRVRGQQAAAFLAHSEAVADAAARVEAARALAAADHDLLMAQLDMGAQMAASDVARRAAEAAATCAENVSAAAARKAALNGAGSPAPMAALLTDVGPVAGAPRTEFRGFTPAQVGAVASEQAGQREAAAVAREAGKATQHSEAVQAALVRQAAARAAASLQLDKARAAAAGVLRITRGGRATLSSTERWGKRLNC